VSPRAGLSGLLLACALWGTPALADTPPRELVAFELNIQANEADVAPWLAQHLELQRYKQLQDLDDQEIRQLLRDADVPRADDAVSIAVVDPLCLLWPPRHLPR
jgi:hypothetical protein